MLKVGCSECLSVGGLWLCGGFCMAVCEREMCVRVFPIKMMLRSGLVWFMAACYFFLQSFAGVGKIENRVIDWLDWKTTFDLNGLLIIIIITWQVTFMLHFSSGNACLSSTWKRAHGLADWIFLGYIYFFQRSMIKDIVQNAIGDEGRQPWIHNVILITKVYLKRFCNK